MAGCCATLHIIVRECSNGQNSYPSTGISIKDEDGNLISVPSGAGFTGPLSSGAYPSTTILVEDEGTYQITTNFFNSFGQVARTVVQNVEAACGINRVEVGEFATTWKVCAGARLHGLPNNINASPVNADGINFTLHKHLLIDPLPGEEVESLAGSNSTNPLISSVCFTVSDRPDTTLNASNYYAVKASKDGYCSDWRAASGFYCPDATINITSADATLIAAQDHTIYYTGCNNIPMLTGVTTDMYRALDADPTSVNDGSMVASLGGPTCCKDNASGQSTTYIDIPYTTFDDSPSGIFANLRSRYVFLSHHTRLEDKLEGSASKCPNTTGSYSEVHMATPKAGYRCACCPVPYKYPLHHSGDGSCDSVTIIPLGSGGTPYCVTGREGRNACMTLSCEYVLDEDGQITGIKYDLSQRAWARRVAKPSNLGSMLIPYSRDCNNEDFSLSWVCKGAELPFNTDLYSYSAHSYVTKSLTDCSPVNLSFSFPDSMAVLIGGAGSESFDIPLPVVSVTITE